MLEPGRFRHKPTLFIFPYDWRNSNARSAQDLARYVTNISRLPEDGKVRIVAHSMGGLVLRQLMVQESALVQIRVESSVTIGSPFLGAPASIFRMLHGDFYDLPIDWLKNPAITYVLPTFDGVCELLPSDAYFELNRTVLGKPVFKEDGWDVNRNRRPTDPLEPDDLRNFLWERFGSAYPEPRSPYDKCRVLHTPQFDDWSSDGTGLRLLHLVGVQDVEATITGVVAKGRHDFGFGEIFQTFFRSYQTILGKGDGTVPVLSAARSQSYLSSRAIVRSMYGDEFKHSPMVGNPRVLEWASHFLGAGSITDGYQKFSASSINGLNADAQVGPNLISFDVVGRSYVEVSTQSGSNSRSGDRVAQIPGVNILYHHGEGPSSSSGGSGSISSVSIDADSAETLLLSGEIQPPQLNFFVRLLTAEPAGGFPEAMTPAEALAAQPLLPLLLDPLVPIEDVYESTRFDGRVSVFVDRRDSSGNVFERYKYVFVIPRTGTEFLGTYPWRLLASAGYPPIGWIDWDLDGEVGGSELVQPEIAAVSPVALNVNPPNLQMQLGPGSEGTGVSFIAEDSPGETVRIFLSIDGGRFTEYHDDGSLDLIVGQKKLIRAFAVDALGNTSRTLEFSLDPALSLLMNAVSPNFLRLTWSISEFPITLETTSGLNIPWIPYVGAVQETDGTRAVTIPVGNEPSRFFRLRLGH